MNLNNIVLTNNFELVLKVEYEKFPGIQAAKLGKLEYFHKCPSTVKVHNDDGLTPLHIAAARGDIELVKTLLSLKAPINVPDNDGNTPLHMASVFYHPLVIMILLNAGANPVVQNINKQNYTEILDYKRLTYSFLRIKKN